MNEIRCNQCGQPSPMTTIADLRQQVERLTDQLAAEREAVKVLARAFGLFVYINADVSRASDEPLISCLGDSIACVLSNPIAAAAVKGQPWRAMGQVNT